MSEKKSLTKKVEKGTDELADTLFSEKKSLTKKEVKGTDKLADTLLSEKKSPTLDVDKGTYKLEFIKQKVKTFCRKGLNLFEGPSTGTKGWSKLDIEFLKTTFSKSHSEFYKELFEKNIEDQDT